MQIVLDEKLEYYIGIMNSLDESVFEDEIIADINIIKNFNPICLPLPLQSFIIKLVYNLFSFEDREKIIKQIKSDFSNIEYIKKLLEEIKKRLEYLELINTELKILLNCTNDSTTCFTNKDDVLSLYDLSKLLSANLIISTESLKTLFRQNLDPNSSNKNNMEYAIEALEYTIGMDDNEKLKTVKAELAKTNIIDDTITISNVESKIMNNEIINSIIKKQISNILSKESFNNNQLKEFLKFITGSTNLPSKLTIQLLDNPNFANINAHTCYNTLDIKSKTGYEIYKQGKSFSTKEYNDFIKEQILLAIKTEGFGTAGGSRITNKIKHKKKSKKIVKKNSKKNNIIKKEKLAKYNKYQKSMKHNMLNINKSKKNNNLNIY